MNKYSLLCVTLLASFLCKADDVNPLRISKIDLIPVNCDGSTPLATVTLEAQGGAKPYMYMLNDAPNDSNVFSDLTAGMSAFSIIDQEGTIIQAIIDVGPSPFEAVTISITEFSEDRYNQGIISFNTQGGGTNPQNILGTIDTTIQQIDQAQGSFDPVSGGMYKVESANLGSPNCPGEATAIFFALILPQPGGNNIADFIAEKYCNQSTNA